MRLALEIRHSDLEEFAGFSRRILINVLLRGKITLREVLKFLRFSLLKTTKNC